MEPALTPDDGGVYDAMGLAIDAEDRGDLVATEAHYREAIARGERCVTDIGDPFSLLDEIPLNNPALYRGLNRRAEAAAQAAWCSSPLGIDESSFLVYSCFGLR